MINGRPTFKHSTVVGAQTLFDPQDEWRMCWSRGSWCIGDKTQMLSDEPHCMACVESDATHPSVMSGEVQWKATASKYDFGSDRNELKAVEGVVLCPQEVQIYVSPAGGGATSTVTVRLWHDTVADLQKQAFSTDKPPQRQQLFLAGKRLEDDGNVLSQHGVVAECTIQLVRQNMFF